MASEMQILRSGIEGAVSMIEKIAQERDQAHDLIRRLRDVYETEECAMDQRCHEPGEWRDRQLHHPECVWTRIDAALADPTKGGDSG